MKRVYCSNNLQIHVLCTHNTNKFQLSMFPLNTQQSVSLPRELPRTHIKQGHRRVGAYLFKPAPGKTRQNGTAYWKHGQLASHQASPYFRRKTRHGIHLTVHHTFPSFAIFKDRAGNFQLGGHCKFFP